MSSEYNQHSRKVLDELLVHGFIRNERLDIPVDIMNVCLLWYHIESIWMTYGDGYELNEEKTIFTQTGFASGSCYGSVIMPSISDKNTEYQFKLQILHNTRGLTIGIDEEKCMHINTDFAGRKTSKNYGYYSQFGTQYDWTLDGCYGVGKLYGVLYGEGDTVSMVFNPFKATLRFTVNNVFIHSNKCILCETF